MGAASGRSTTLRVAAQFCDDADLDSAGFGQHVFKGDVASKYLSKYGESGSLLDTPAWTASKSDTVASALLDWARDNGASVYCHWFCPMGSSGALSYPVACQAAWPAARVWVGRGIEDSAPVIKPQPTTT